LFYATFCSLEILAHAQWEGITHGYDFQEGESLGAVLEAGRKKKKKEYIHSLQRVFLKIAPTNPACLSLVHI
jgi:hypothetical protein